MFRKFYIDIITPVIVGLLFIMAMLIATTYAADAQVLGTYVEQNGATKNQIGVTIMADATGTSITTDCGGVGCALASQLPATLGIKTAALSMSVAPASDGVFNTTQSMMSNPTYIANFTGYAGYTNATTTVCIVGSATKVVRVTTFTLYGVATAATKVDFAFIKYVTANTGGTATQPTAFDMDSADPVATAVVNLYSAAPTTGTLAGTVTYVGTTLSASTNAPVAVQLTSATARELPRVMSDQRRGAVLRGVGESLCVVYTTGGALPTGFSAYGLIEWTESAT